MTGQSLLRTHRAPCALVMAGGTGGHIFPGLAVAQALRAQGWQVHWLGAPASMESRLVPPRGRQRNRRIAGFLGQAAHSPRLRNSR